MVFCKIIVMKNFQDNFLPITVIHLISIVSAVLGFLDFEIVGLSLAFPLLDVITIYYFRIFRKVFSLWFIFFLGLITDSLAGGALGVTSLVYIICVAVFEYLEVRLVIKDDFKQVLRRFLAFMACFLLLKWSVLSIISFANYSFVMIVIQFVISSVCYVIVHRILESFYDSHFR